MNDSQPAKPVKAPTIGELLRCIEAFNKQAELHAALPAAIRARPNPLLDSLYVAAQRAADSLAPLMQVKFQPVLLKPTAPPE